MSEFNILYWNIHYADGYVGTKIKYILSSEIIKNTIKKILNQKEIDAVVFTEAYPQIEDGKHNVMLYEYFKATGYNIYPYDLNSFKSNEYPFKTTKYTNGILIATKEHFYKQNIKVIPNYLLLKHSQKDIYLGGVRICFDKNFEYDKQIEEVSNSLKEFNNVILLGDFNPGSRETEKIQDVLNKSSKGGILYDVLSGESKVSPKPSDFNKESGYIIDLINNRGLYLNYTDKIFCKGVKVKKFEKIYTPEQLYCNEQFLEDDGHIKREYMYWEKKHIKGDCKPAICSIIDEKYLYKVNIQCIKDIGLGYQNYTLCNTPFPDHNLLFASIDLGD